MPRRRTLCFAAAFAFATAAYSRADPAPLPSYNADISQTSVSGISSGAFMAVQFATAWSSITVGIGAIAGGPFGCSQGSASAALSTCMGGQPAPDLTELIRQADAWSKSGAIDDTVNIAGQRIYLFNGYNDAVVARSVTDALQAFYVHYLGQHGLARLFYQTSIGAGHSQVTMDFGGSCSTNGGEFINRCGYDQAGIILQHIYGALAARNEGTLGGHVITFAQGDFTGTRKPIEDSLDDIGFAYIPAACEAREPCRVHLALHGCLQSYANIGDDFVRHAGYNEWADNNHIIILYPQIKAVGLTTLGITNPQACWDWWGYLDANPMQSPTYLLKSGHQTSAIKGMIDRITSGRAASAPPAGSGPTAPSNLRAIDATDSAVDLAWSSAPGAVSYDVFRAGPDEQTFRHIGSIPGLSYSDRALRPLTSYRYKVCVSQSDCSPVISRDTRRKVPPCDEPGTCAVR